ncbi:hypothetical protein [Methanospirillum hungatei]|uniref:hypothetical protein n=1 Tax=Methanospirillum hungatei TaxID=2203 RepID=UPI0026EF66CE|nr:hypothetical protein [Methanospirillum hungatei]MCA1917421.1 hypothetical protein [Methanospirillum hungatei]
MKMASASPFLVPCRRHPKSPGLQEREELAYLCYVLLLDPNHTSRRKQLTGSDHMWSSGGLSTTDARVRR